MVLSRGSRSGATRASMAARASYARGRRCSLIVVRGSSISKTGTGRCYRSHPVAERCGCLRALARWEGESEQLEGTAGLRFVWTRQFRDKAVTADTGGCHRRQGKDIDLGGGGARRRRLVGGGLLFRPKFKWGFLCSAPCCEWERSGKCVPDDWGWARARQPTVLGKMGGMVTDQRDMIAQLCCLV